MKFELFQTEANKIWKKVSAESSDKQLAFELNLYRKLLSFFQVGEYYYWIFNLTYNKLDLVSKEIEDILGYQPAEFTLRVLMDNTHPDDRPYFLNFENKAANFLASLPAEKLLKYKIRYDFRIRNKMGVYIRILHQSIIVEHDDRGNIIRTFGVHTDITHLKPEGKPVLSIIGFEGEPSYINVDVEKVFAVSKEILTKREKQVLTLLIEGKLSKQIADTLKISKQTVDRHRKNMIAKNGFSNTAELISNAIRKGWL
jgi:DNA-binding CsgD family transcriptional regulator